MNISIRARRTLVAGLAAVVCTFGLMAAVVPVANAASGPIFTVMNTSETLPDGVWFRNSPHTADTSRTTGLGVYKNEQVQLQCYAFGDAVGRYNNSLWYYVNDVTRPTNNGRPNVGFLNAHYINDGQNANVVDAGVPACVNNAPPTVPPPASTPTVTLAQGPAAPAGYRYAITLAGFPGNSSVSISCRDSVSPNGFYTFSLTTNASGQAFTQSYCYSGDGPDHWVVANGSVESNHVSWGGSSTNNGGGGTPPPSSAPTPPPSTTPIGTIPNQGYDRSAAVSWALAHAKDPQAYGAMCTWFVSNALWAGGFTKTAAWTDQGHYRSAPGTKIAWWLPDFLPYIQSNYSTSLKDITSDLRTNAVPQAEAGDMILYDWGDGHGISHVAFIVDIASGQYPEVSEMGQFDFGLLDAAINKIVHVRSPYVKRGWTWSAINNNWLQSDPKHRGMKAYLLHINGGYFIPSY